MQQAVNRESSIIRFFLLSILCAFVITGCDHLAEKHNSSGGTASAAKADSSEKPEYFLLRPKLEKEYGYSHAVRIGNDLKISGAVSMDDTGMIVGAGSMEQQMKNCYSDLLKILDHYGFTYDDVVVENIYTTSMPDFLKVSGFRNSIYKKQFPTGTWLEVKGLAVEGQLIEIDMEAHKNN